MVNFVFKLKDREGKKIFLPNDEHDDVKRAAFNAEREYVSSFVGSLPCPQGLPMCGVSIAICENKFLEVVNMCHEEYVKLIRERLVGSGYQFRKLTILE